MYSQKTHMSFHPICRLHLQIKYIVEGQIYGMVFSVTCFSIRRHGVWETSVTRVWIFYVASWMVNRGLQSSIAPTAPIGRFTNIASGESIWYYRLIAVWHSVTAYTRSRGYEPVGNGRCDRKKYSLQRNTIKRSDVRKAKYERVRGSTW